MTWIVSIKPAHGGGPVLVSDDPRVVAAVMRAITNVYAPTANDPPRARQQEVGK